MSNANTPSGFTPRSLTRWNRYYVPQADTNAYRVGDVVKSSSGSDAVGVPTVTLHSGASGVAVRGVVVAVDPGLPATGGFIGGTRMSVPAVKTKDYYLWVCDDPEIDFIAVDDGTTPSALVAANIGAFCGFAPAASGAANGGSAAALSSSSFGGTTGACKVVSLAPGSVYGAFAAWIVRFPLHELGTAPTQSSGGGGGGGGGGSGGVTTQEPTSRALVAGDNGNSGITPNAISLTVNAGMPAGFNFDTAGPGLVAWVQGPGVQIQDQRQAGNTYFVNLLKWVADNTYVVIGGKS
ncbi:MAG: hypothetical protein ACTHK2_03920 [Dokdonella sp.]|uniref:hypothetical protein n=1 Tax=Dokdonella sp. TaxID=2291710 RepID=UPI003F810377